MSLRASAEMKPGMSIPTGHPGTQRGFLQRMQRSASCSAPSRSEPQRHFLEIMPPLLGALVRHGRALGRNGLDVLGQARPGARG